MVENRPKIDKEKLVKDFGAHVFPAKIALENGYVDEAGATRSQVLKDLAGLAKMDEKKMQVVRLEKKNWVYDFFSSDSSVRSGTIKHQIQLDSSFDPALSNKFLYLYKP